MFTVKLIEKYPSSFLKIPDAGITVYKEKVIELKFLHAGVVRLQKAKVLIIEEIPEPKQEKKSILDSEFVHLISRVKEIEKPEETEIEKLEEPETEKHEETDLYRRGRKKKVK